MEVDAPSLCKKLVAIALIALVVGNQRNPSRISGCGFVITILYDTSARDLICAMRIPSNSNKACF